MILVADCYGKVIQFPLTEDLTEITVGSLPENHLSLPYKGISRHHFTLIRKQSAWLLKDLGSTNGTKLNGHKVAESEIKPGDLIRAGAVELRVAESEMDKLVRVPKDRISPKELAHTDRVTTRGQMQAGDIFISGKLVFPEGMIPGKSAVMMDIYQKLHSIVDSDISVLLTGETGTGKEMFARMLHLSGKRSQGPFVAVNCAAIPADLLEAELFGIGEKVATGVSQRTGKIPTADKGTLFLDELSAFPLELQAKILRAIEERSVTPVGKHVPIPVDFRLVCATNEEPRELMRSGRLREDLYHRIATLEVSIPPLRERKEDLPSMIVGLLQQICSRQDKTLAGISRNLLLVLTSYSYPGNVRELINLLSAMTALAHPGEMLDVHLAPGKLLQAGYGTGMPDLEPDSEDEDHVDLRSKLDETSRKWILRALKKHDGKIGPAAKSLGVTSFGLRKMMKRLGIPLP